MVSSFKLIVSAFHLSVIPHSFSSLRIFLGDLMIDFFKNSIFVICGVNGERKFACSVLSLPSWFCQRLYKNLNLVKNEIFIRWLNKLWFLFWKVDAIINEDWQFKYITMKTSVNKTSDQEYIYMKLERHIFVMLLVFLVFCSLGEGRKHGFRSHCLPCLNNL